MKKIIIISIIFITNLLSKTLVVDDDYNPWGWGSSICEHGSQKSGWIVSYYDYNKIKDALDDAVDGDIIRICPGTYKEQKLTITQSNLKIQSTTANYSDVKITNQNLSSKTNIFRIPNYIDEFVLAGVGIYQYTSNHSGIYSNNYIKNINIDNVYIYSKGRGIYENNSIENFIISNSKIESNKESVYLKGINNNITFKDINFKTNSDYSTIKTTNWGIIKIYSQNNYNILNSQKYGVDIDQGELNITKTKFETKNHSIYLRNNLGKVSITNNVFISDNRGIYSAGELDDKVYIQNNKITLNNNNEGMYLKKILANSYINDNNISGGNYGIKINDASNSGEIKNNIIKNASTKGLYLLSSKKWRSFQVTNNCFENGSGKNIQSKDKDGYFDSNYYDDWGGSGSYTIPTIPKYDNNPLSSCNLESNNSEEYETCSISHFSTQSEIDQNWTIIKQQNYTPQVVNQKLRLTTNSGNIATGLTLSNKVFKANSTKFKIRFKHYAYDGSSSKGADGIAVVFSDASITPVAGAFGGSLGYAQRTSPNNEDGFAGGWIGIGLDEYGNYSNPTEGRVGGPGFKAQAVAIRGSHLENYKYLTGTNTLTPPISDGNSHTPSPGYTYEVRVDTTQTNKTIISVYRDTGSGNDILINQYEYNSSNTPEYFKFSITGSTGGENNIHEIDDLEILALDCSSTFVTPQTENNFSIKEINRSDENITTKIVNKSFNLEVYSNSNFTGTLCSVVIDENGHTISSWFKNYFNDVNSTSSTSQGNPNYTVISASKNSRIKMEWIYNEDETCPLSEINGSTFSNDNFAARPKEFRIENSSSHIYAGGDFILTFKALDENGNETSDYNETNSFEINSTENKAGCKTGVLDVNVNFSNGQSESVAKYSETGDINVTIRDLNFANVDIDDTSVNDRVINPYTITINSYPYDSNITSIFSNNSIIYIDKNLSRYAKLNTTIKMVDKQGNILENFDSSCYADDVNLTFSVNNNIVDSFIGMYNINGIDENDSQFQKWGNNFEIDSNLFNKGEANLTIKFNIYKNKTYPVSIVDLNFTKATLDYPKAPIHKEKSLNKNLSFYYLRVVADDITTTETNSSGKVYILVYDRNRNHFSDEKLLYWFLDTNYNEDDVKILGYTSGFKYDTNLTNFNVNLSKKVYDYNLSVNNPDKIHFGVIHYKTPTYLWYSKYKEYNDSLYSYCLTHHCSEYIYKSKDIMTKSIGSGKFQGSEVNITTPKRKKFGIKMYR